MRRINKQPRHLTKCHQANIINKYVCVGVSVCFSVYLFIRLLSSSIFQGECVDQIWSGDEPYNWSERIFNLGIPARRTKALSHGKHQRGDGADWREVREKKRVHLLATEATKGCGIILSNKYWFRGNKRTWQKPTASLMALTGLSLIGHSIRLLRTPRSGVSVYRAVWILKFMD